MSEKFIKIDNELLKTIDKNRVNMFTRIGTEGFTLYSYLLTQQSGNEFCNINIRMIQNFICRDYDKRPSLSYGKNVKCKISCLKSKKTISIYLEALHSNNIITIHNYEDLKSKYTKDNNFKFENININDILLISCNYIPENKFTILPFDIFFNYIHKIGHVGWSLLCLLSNLHNIEYGNIQDGGFADPSEDYLSRTINKSLNTNKAYLYLLQSQKIIKILPQPVITIRNKFGEEEPTYTPNHYIVRWKMNGDKNYFYIKTKKDE